MSRSNLANLTAARSEAPQGVSQTAQSAMRRLATMPADGRTPCIQLARAEIRGNQVLVRPERSDIPHFNLPNNTAAQGFSPGWSTHDYLVINLAPASLRGAPGLRLIGDALVANPTPGVDQRSTPRGTRNDVGNLVLGDGDDNFVRSYSIPTTDPSRSTAVVNYTIQGQHAMSEGFVVRFARLRSDGRIELVTYGEGDAIKQSTALKFYWGGVVSRVWTENAVEIFNAAERGGR